MRCPGWPCDTQYAIVPELYLADSEKLLPQKLAMRVVDAAVEKGATNICLTGGEPFMQKDELLHEFWADAVRFAAGEYNIELTWEAFTNGSFPFPSWAKRIHKMLDWKLPGSGEADTAIQQRVANAMGLTDRDGIKFVVKDQEDLMAAVHEFTRLDELGIKAKYWVGRAWDTAITDQDLINFIQEMHMPWNLNVQVHKYIFPNIERGV